MQTTAIYSNRMDDKAKVEGMLGLPEFPGSQRWVFSFKGVEIAHNYNRIVYGDHGPYLEFEPIHVVCELVNKFPGTQKPGIYFVWMHPKGMPDLKVYHQARTVAHIKNAPIREDGKPSSFNRSEGYADYKVGKIYIDPFKLTCKRLDTTSA